MAQGYRITKRNGSGNLYARIYIPDDLKRAAGGKAEVWRSLGTSSMKEAKLKAPGVVDKYLATLHPRISTPTAPEMPSAPEPSREQIQAAALGVYHALLESDEDERIHDAEASQPGGADNAAANKAYAQEVRQHLARGDLRHGDLEGWSGHFGFHFNPGSVLRREFQHMLARAEAEAAERAAERDLGLPLSTPADDLFRAPAAPYTPPTSTPATPAPTKPSAPPLEDLWPTYERQQGANLAPATITDKKKILDIFIYHIGHGRAVDTITKAEAREYRDMLTRMPRHAGSKARTRGMSLKQLVELNDREQGQAVSTRTVTKQVSVLSSIFNWLVREGHVESNIWEHLAPAKERGRNKRMPFTYTQLQHLIDSPLFAGCVGIKDVRQKSTPGTFKATGPEYWLPLLGMFTGARLGELAQLETSDVKQAEGIDFIMITDQGGDRARTVKSKAAIRSVPIHSRLIALGFLEHVAKISRAGSGRLFPTLNRNNKGQFANASRHFSRYLDAIDLPVAEDASKPTFHCLRHSFIDELRREHSEHEFRPLVGHEAQTVTRGYGIKETFGLGMRKAMVEAVVYPGVDFSGFMKRIAHNSANGL
ncbi:site-specific integrase [uncultured Mameliella sp.]|uniref:site-specific integrase n=1 Tax=uncultured Mameliella sp. TaxID=1447087 RepID=UPI00261E9FB6|nr:site-specific integrase [uncultured Mameliella sp.]